MTEYEQAAMDAIAKAMLAVMNVGDDKLVANQGELLAAIHVLQSFVSQHMLHRQDPDNWSAWYRLAEAKEEG